MSRRSWPASSAAVPRSCSSRRSRWRCRSWTGSGPISTPGSRSSTPACPTVSAPTSGAGSGAATSTSSSGTRLAVLAPLDDVGRRHRRRGARRRVQERPDAPDPGPRHGAFDWPSWRARRSILGSATPAVEIGRPGARRHVPPGRPAVAPDRRAGRPSRSSTSRAELQAGNRGLLSAAPGRGDHGPRSGGRRPGDPHPQPARDRVGRPVPRLRPRPGLPGLRAAARLPPGRHDACAVTTAAGPRPIATRCPNCRRRGSATSAAARSGSRRRSGGAFRTCASAGSIATSSNAAAPRSG